MGYPEPVSTTESIPLPTADIQLMLLGADSVGKSCLWSSWDTNTFPESPQPTVGARFWKKQIFLSNHCVHLHLWDTPGQDRFDSLAPMYYRDAHAAVVLYDPLSHRSWEKARFWVTELQEKARRQFSVFLGCTKMDLCSSSLSPPNTVVPFEDVLTFVQERNIKGWMPLSSKKGVNSNRFLVMIVSELLEKQVMRDSVRMQRLSLSPLQCSLVLQAQVQAADERLKCQPWMPDSASASCMLCHAKFTLLFRRHHCRRCGRLCCAECSKRKAKIPNHPRYEVRTTRVCCQCFPVLAQLEINKH